MAGIESRVFNYGGDSYLLTKASGKTKKPNMRMSCGQSAAWDSNVDHLELKRLNPDGSLETVRVKEHIKPSSIDILGKDSDFVTHRITRHNLLTGETSDVARWKNARKMVSDPDYTRATKVKFDMGDKFVLDYISGLLERNGKSSSKFDLKSIKLDLSSEKLAGAELSNTAKYYIKKALKFI